MLHLFYTLIILLGSVATADEGIHTESSAASSNRPRANAQDPNLLLYQCAIAANQLGTASTDSFCYHATPQLPVILLKPGLPERQLAFLAITNEGVLNYALPTSAIGTEGDRRIFPPFVASGSGFRMSINPTTNSNDASRPLCDVVSRQEARSHAILSPTETNRDNDVDLAKQIIATHIRTEVARGYVNAWVETPYSRQRRRDQLSELQRSCCLVPGVTSSVNELNLQLQSPRQFHSPLKPEDERDFRDQLSTQGCPELLS